MAKEEKKKKGKRTDLEKSLEGLEEIGREEFFKAKEGKNTIRILPPWNEEGKFYFIGKLHYGISSSNLPIPCREAIGKTCPICEAIKNIKDRDIARKLSQRTRVYMNVIDRAKPAQGVKVLGCTPKQMKQLRGYLEDSDFGDITDPEDGRDVIIEKDSSTTPNTYDIRVRPKSSPIDYDEWEAELHKLDEIQEFPPIEEYKRMAKRLKGDEEEEEEDEDKAKKSKKKKEAEEEEDDEKERNKKAKKSKEKDEGEDDD